MPGLLRRAFASAWEFWELAGGNIFSSPRARGPASSAIDASSVLSKPGAQPAFSGFDRQDRGRVVWMEGILTTEDSIEKYNHLNLREILVRVMLRLGGGRTG